VRRLKQYKIKSPTFKIVKSGIRLSIPFEKEVNTNGDKNNLIGIDVGVTDLLYTSKGKSIGNYSKIVKHYEENVMPKMKNRSNLKNLMKKYQSELRDKNTNEFRKDFLRRKINNINKMLQGKNTKNRILRSYYHMQDVEISTVVKDYVDLIKDTNAITVIEDLDIVNFDRGKTANRRDSMWSRGQLLKKIEEYLSWNGLELIKVDPAYTSKVCPHCFNIDDSNRKGKSFKCSSCGHKDDADHNAAVNIKSRAFDEEIKDITKKYKYNTKKRHTELKNLYALRHEKYKTTVA
jgi:IS605 OrfB family transposase